MKRKALPILVLLIMTLNNTFLQAQSLTEDIKQDIKKEAKKAEKEAKKLEQKLKGEVNYKEAVDALLGGAFVLEADKIVFKRGRSAFVSPSTNFVSLADGEATVQVAFNSSVIVGSNGIGGVTVDGRASKIEMKTDKKGNVTYSMNILGARVSAQVIIKLYKGNNEADVSVIPNFNSERITLSGVLLPIEKSSIFKGRTL